MAKLDETISAKIDALLAAPGTTTAFFDAACWMTWSDKSAFCRGHRTGTGPMVLYCCPALVTLLHVMSAAHVFGPGWIGEIFWFRGTDGSDHYRKLIEVRRVTDPAGDPDLCVGVLGDVDTLAPSPLPSDVFTPLRVAPAGWLKQLPGSQHAAAGFYVGRIQHAQVFDFDTLSLLGSWVARHSTDPVRDATWTDEGPGDSGTPVCFLLTSGEPIYVGVGEGGGVAVANYIPAINTLLGMDGSYSLNQINLSAYDIYPPTVVSATAFVTVAVLTLNSSTRETTSPTTYQWNSATVNTMSGAVAIPTATSPAAVVSMLPGDYHVQLVATGADAQTATSAVIGPLHVTAPNSEGTAMGWAKLFTIVDPGLGPLWQASDGSLDYTVDSNAAELVSVSALDVLSSAISVPDMVISLGYAVDASTAVVKTAGRDVRFLDLASGVTTTKGRVSSNAGVTLDGLVYLGGTTIGAITTLAGQTRLQTLTLSTGVTAMTALTTINVNGGGGPACDFHVGGYLYVDGSTTGVLVHVDSTFSGIVQTFDLTSLLGEGVAIAAIGRVAGTSNEYRLYTDNGIDHLTYDAATSTFARNRIRGTDLASRGRYT